jgi:myo-inositol-1-phosphate synthase
VAATTVVGGAALARGLAPRTGLVTESAPFTQLPLVPIISLVFGGHDITDVPLGDAARALCRSAGPLEPDLVRAVERDLAATDARLRPAPQRRPTGPLREFVERVQADLAAFTRATGARRTVVVNLASTEPPIVADAAHESLRAFEAALDRRSPPSAVVLPASVLFAYAALAAGMPYINFTPSAGAGLRALEELGRERGVPHAGADGKTGETLLKSAVAPMFHMRRLEVKSWTGLNLLGNADGLALSAPEVKSSKVASKHGVVPAILGYQPHTLVRIEYVPTLGDWKTAWDLVQFEGFLGTPMSLQLTWQGSDSALAAPLVLDLVRLVDLAATRGERGALGWLAFFFKSPVGCEVHDLGVQYELLCRHLGCG